MKTIWGMLGMLIVAIVIVAFFVSLAFIGVSILAIAVLPLVYVYGIYGIGGTIIYSALVAVFSTLILVGIVQALAEKFNQTPKAV